MRSGEREEEGGGEGERKCKLRQGKVKRAGSQEWGREGRGDC